METYKLYTDMVKGMMFLLAVSPNWHCEKQYWLRFPLIAKNGRLDLYLRTRPDSYQTKVFVKRLNEDKPTKLPIDEAIKLLTEHWFSIDELTMYEMIAEYDGHKIRKKYIARMVVSEPESKPWREKKGMRWKSVYL